MKPDQDLIPGPAKAHKAVPAYLFLGGWGDGWSEISPGAEVWLLARIGDQVRFLAGSKGPVEGEIRGGGLFGVEYLEAFSKP